MDYSDYVVTFCIPTYNQADIIYRLVTQILSSTETRFQVVVSDNNSTDHTWDKLSTISDSRLKLCKNPYSCTPPALNWLNALNQGDGRWLYLVMGRDLILADNVPKLIGQLEKAERKKVAFVYENTAGSAFSSHYPDNSKQYRYYTKKSDALQRFMLPDHPTGNIFRKDVFMTIPNKEKACMVIDTYPENYFKCKIIENWNCAELPPIVNKEVLWAWGSHIPHSTFNPDPNSVHWFPSRRIKQFIQMMDLICMHTLSVVEHEMVFIQLWESLVSHVSVGFSELCIDRVPCIHYGVRPRKVTKKEMIQNIFLAYHEVNCHYPDMSVRKKRKMISTMINKIYEILFNPYYGRLKNQFKKMSRST